MTDLETKGLLKLKKILDFYVGTLTTRDEDSGRLVKVNKKFANTKEFITELKHRTQMGDKTFDGLRIPFMLKWLTKGEQKIPVQILKQLNLNGRTDTIKVKGRTAKIIPG